MKTQLARLDNDHPMLTNPQLLKSAIERLLRVHRVRFDRLWAYYRNPMRPSDVVDPTSADRPYRQAQEWGLPPRVTGAIAGVRVFESSPVGGVERKDVVIENDIGWRIDTMVDFLFGRPIVLNSACADPAKRAQIETLLRHILACNGGIVFLQQVALLGAVYGSVDVLVKYVPEAALDPSITACATQLLGEMTPKALSDARSDLDLHPKQPTGQSPAEPAPDAPAALPDAQASDPSDPGASHPSPGALERLARMVRFEIVEPARALPLLDARDCRVVSAFATVYQLERTGATQLTRHRWLSKWLQNQPVDPKRLTVTELISASRWQRYEDDELVAEGENSLGRLPLVHIQNAPNPLSFFGASDVEPLIPLQDELNTRLSDRAHRIAMTSFRMYLGKGIENFTEMPIAPGRMWSTDNLDASVVEFGGESACPSEDLHIQDIREAMDKLSGTSPIAAGAIKGRIGRLTSAAALRVTMMSLLSRTERKRTAYGLAIAQLCELSLAWLDRAGVFATTPEERAIHIHWANPIPANESERLEEARIKQSVGVPRETVLRELGYATPLENRHPAPDPRDAQSTRGSSSNSME